MSVPMSKRKVSHLETFINARQLAQYTIEITANKNTFIEKYRKPLVERIVDLAIGIHIKLWTAYNLEIGVDQSAYVSRASLQTEVIADCTVLLSLIDIAYKVFHLKSNRIVYWSDLVIKVRERTKLWKKHDKHKYSKRFK